MGIDVTITQTHIAKLLGMDDHGRYALNIKDNFFYFGCKEEEDKEYGVSRRRRSWW